MSRFIALTKLAAEQARHDDDDFQATDDVNEPQQGREGQAVVPAQDNRLVVNADAIRCFYPRKNNKPGTRITFIDGGGFPVAESYDYVRTLLMPN